MIEAVGHQYLDTFFRTLQRAARARRHDAAAGDHDRGPALRARRATRSTSSSATSSPAAASRRSRALSASVARARRCASSTSRTSARTTRRRCAHWRANLLRNARRVRVRSATASVPAHVGVLLQLLRGRLRRARARRRADRADPSARLTATRGSRSRRGLGRIGRFSSIGHDQPAPLGSRRHTERNRATTLPVGRAHRPGGGGERAVADHHHLDRAPRKTAPARLRRSASTHPPQPPCRAAPIPADPTTTRCAATENVRTLPAAALHHRAREDDLGVPHLALQRIEIGSGLGGRRHRGHHQRRGRQHGAAFHRRAV